jgi:hypothetical protein
VALEPLPLRELWKCSKFLLKARHNADLRAKLTLDLFQLDQMPVDSVQNQQHKPQSLGTWRKQTGLSLLFFLPTPFLFLLLLSLLFPFKKSLCPTLPH